MEKQENIEIKDYLISFVSEQLEQCALFTETFGKSFARRSLKRNLNKVYTNDLDESKAARYSPIDRNITFCTKEENSQLLTVDDIKTNPGLEATMLHEGIHAVLNKSKIACKANGIIYGTGISEITERGEEYGRGLNEGLTNWICEKTGIPKNTYPEETNFVRQLELALGEKAIMKMAKGGIRKNVSKQLQMTPKECYHFLEMADDIYNIKAQLASYRVVERILTNFINILSYSSEERSQIYIEFEKMTSSNYTYYLMQHSFPYLEFITEREVSLENELEFVSQLIKEEDSELSKKIAEIESKIFNKYFKKKLKKIIADGNISEKDYKKYILLSEIMETNLEDQTLEQYSSYRFLKNFKKTFEQLSQSKSQQFREIYKVAIPSYSEERIEAAQKVKQSTINKTNKEEQK